MTRAEATEAFWQWALKEWTENDWSVDLDFGDARDKAVELGLLQRVPYDPAVHGEIDADAGDEIDVPVAP